MRALLTGRAPVSMRAVAAPREVSVPGVLFGVLVAAAVGYIAAFAVAALFRLSYPFPLEITEAAMLRGVERVLHGEPLYLAPTLQHVPYIYGPVYFYLSAAMALVTGVSYLPLRLVSLVASIGTLSLVGRLVFRETGSLGAGVIAAGLLAATFPLAQTALDLGRVDALFVFFLIAALYLARTESLRARPRWLVLGAIGCLLALAGLTKIPTGAAPVGLAIGLYLLATVRLRVLPVVVGFALPLAGIVLLLRAQMGPWPTWYLWDLPAQHDIRESLVARFWFLDLLPRFTLPLILGPVFVFGRALRRDRTSVLFYGLAALGLIGLSWASRSGTGGAINVLLPAHVLVAVLLGLGVHESLAQIGGSTPRARAFQCYVLGVCIIQFALIAYNARMTVPYLSDQWADERLAARLAALPGPIFAPDLDGYLRTSDKGEQPHNGAVDEIVGGYGGRPSQEGLRWRAELASALGQHTFRFVVLSQLDDPCCGLSRMVLADGYVDAGPLFPPDDDFFRWKTTHGHTPEERLYAAPEEVR